MTHLENFNDPRNPLLVRDWPVVSFYYRMKELVQAERDWKPWHTPLRNKRMKIAQIRGVHTQEEWQKLLGQSGGSCRKCGSKELIEKDHIVPIARGGCDCIQNIQPLCRKCNIKKGVS